MVLRSSGLIRTSTVSLWFSGATSELDISANSVPIRFRRTSEDTFKDVVLIVSSNCSVKMLEFKSKFQLLKDGCCKSASNILTGMASCLDLLMILFSL